MKHCFVVNPSAGKGTPVKLIPEIERICGENGFDFEIYRTEGKEDAIGYVRSVTSKGEKVRVYAVGGDGTLNDVLNGIADFENTVLVSIACGTGNDFVKSFTTDPSLWHKVELAVKAEPMQLDYFNFADKRCLNICNVGLDSNAAYYMQQYKKLPLMKGSMPYFMGVMKSLCGVPWYHLRLDLDGEKMEGDFMLAAFGNGQYYGGAYRATPLADLRDGLIDMCLVNKVSRLKVINWINEYKRGEHINSPHFNNILTYRKLGRIAVECDKQMLVCFDGEIVSMDRFELTVVKKGVSFAAAGCSLT